MKKLLSLVLTLAVVGTFGWAREVQGQQDTTGSTAQSTTGNLGSAPQDQTQSTEAPPATPETTPRSGDQSMTAAGGSSDQVRSNIQNALHNTPNLASSNVHVDVTDSKVVLSGSVPDQKAKAYVRRVAQQNARGRQVVDTDLLIK
jgi:osmotically-inducible protein OsmY